jgi:hypothetical protein
MLDFPTPLQVWNGTALNTILAALQQLVRPGDPGPLVPLDPQLMAPVGFTTVPLGTGAANRGVPAASVGELVQTMLDRGLTFAPAVRGAEPAYDALHGAPVAYYNALTQPTIRYEPGASGASALAPKGRHMVAQGITLVVPPGRGRGALASAGGCPRRRAAAINPGGSPHPTAHWSKS